jgi:hypothetical protein
LEDTYLSEDERGELAAIDEIDTFFLELLENEYQDFLWQSQFN